MRAPRLLVTIGVLTALCLACSVSKREEGDGAHKGKRDAPAAKGADKANDKAAPAVTGDLGLAREALLKHTEDCYRANPAYCVTDPTFVDPVLREVIARSFEGVAPTTADQAEAVALRTRGAWSAATFETPESRARVEAAIAATWDMPTVKRDRGLVTAELGVPPGKMEKTGRAGWNVVVSDAVDHGEVVGKVAASKLQDLREAYSDATTWVIVVDVPALSGDFTKHEIRYSKVRDRITVKRQDRSNQVWYTPQLNDDLSWYISGERSLKMEGLESCKLKDAIWGAEPDCLR